MSLSAPSHNKGNTIPMVRDQYQIYCNLTLQAEPFPRQNWKAFEIQSSTNNGAGGFIQHKVSDQGHCRFQTAINGCVSSRRRQPGKAKIGWKDSRLGRNRLNSGDTGSCFTRMHDDSFKPDQTRIPDPFRKQVQLPEKLGRWVIEGALGTGGWGEVHQVRHVFTGEVAAIKVLHPKLAADEECATRFEREARSLLRLAECGQIVTVKDYERSEGFHYLVMELVAGFKPDGALESVRSLAQWIEWKKQQQKELWFDENTVKRIAIDVLKALTHAHGNGMVHRDIKPGNILLDPSGQAKLADFGLVKAVASSEMTRTRSVGLYSPNYESPEQAEGNEIDAKSDLYSLGIVLYQMLVGKLPQINYRSPNEKRSEISKSWDELVNRALEEDPKDRWESAEEMLSIINRIDPQTETQDPPSIKPVSSSLTNKKEIAHAESAKPVRPTESKTKKFHFFLLLLLATISVLYFYPFLKNHYLFEKAETLIKKGDEAESLLDAGNFYRDAEAYYDAICESDRRHPKAILYYYEYLVFNKGEKLEASGDFEQALKVYRKCRDVISLISRSGDRETKLKAWRAAGVIQERIGDANRARGIDPESEYLEALDRIDARSVDDTNRFQLNIDRAVILDRLGDLEFEAGDFEASRKYYEDAYNHRKDPDVRNSSLTGDLDYFVSLINLGNAALGLEKIVEARDWYQQAEALTKEKTGFEWQENLAISLEKQGMVAKLEGRYSTAMGNKAASDGNQVEADKHFDDAQEWYALSIDLLKRSSSQLMALNNPDFKALERNISLHLDTGRIYEKLRDYKSADASCEQAVQLARSQGGRPRGRQILQIALNNRCWVRILQEEFEDALKDAEEAINIDLGKLPGSRTLKVNLATAHLFHGNYETACVRYEEAFGINPNSELPQTPNERIDFFKNDLKIFEELGIPTDSKNRKNLDSIKKRFDLFEVK